MNKDLQDYGARPRHWARASIVAPFAALLLGALGKQLMHKQEEAVAEQINLIVGIVASMLIFAGLAAGFAALIGTWRGSRDTRIMAALGLFCGGGVLALWLYAYWFVATAG